MVGRMNGPHDRDFYGWAQEQAALLRAGNLSEADIVHIAEEIESLGRGEQQRLEDRLIVLLLHLLKWQFQPNFRGNSWRLSIKEQRVKIARHLRKNPSLKALLDEMIADPMAMLSLAPSAKRGCRNRHSRPHALGPSLR
jgi:hypothetical protein